MGSIGDRGLMIAAIIQESFYSFAKHIVRKSTISL